jgi:hypothetical protein
VDEWKKLGQRQVCVFLSLKLLEIDDGGWIMAAL